MFTVMDARLLRDWVRTAVEALGEARAEIDALNVFPVPDGDTGTNMFLTMEAAERAMEEAPSVTVDEVATSDVTAAESGQGPGGSQSAAPVRAAAEAEVMSELSDALVTGALLGARGNSGVILSQILRGLMRVDPVLPDGRLRPAGDAIRIGLQRAAEMAYSAVADPKEGTMLTVIRKAAEGAAVVEGDDLADVVRGATTAADEALAHTTEQLEALRRAGVVDSGGRGIVVVLSALQEVVTGERRPPPPAHRKLPVPVAEDDGHYRGPGYEVMFLLEADDERIPELKERLAELGDSLLVVGGERLWNVHVHVDDAGAAVEAGLATGRPYRIRITWLLDQADSAHPQRAGRGLVTVAHGQGMVEMLTDMGVAALPVRPGRAPATGDLLDAVMAQERAEVVIMPGDKNINSSAEAAAVKAREQGLRVAVVPTRSVVQTLAAIAVHDSGLPFDDDVVGMSRAAGATRYGAVTVSTREAMTTAGRCSPGDILGIVDGDILAIGDELQAVARSAFDLLLSSGGELVTIVAGSDADEELVAGVTGYVKEQHPAVDVTVFAGGQPLWPLIFGVE